MFKIKYLSEKLVTFLNNKINSFLKKKNYLIIFRYGNAIGDHLCMTGIVAKIYNKKLKIIIFSNYPELFQNNPKISKVYNLKNFFNRKILLKFLNLFQGECIKSYRNKIAQTNEFHFMKFYPKNTHFGLASAFHFDMNLNSNNFKNEIFLSDNEINDYQEKFNLPKNYSLIHSEAKKTYMKNKNWGPKKIQKIIDKYKDINWIQVGRPGEFVLKKTKKCYFNISLRELAFIMYNSEFMICMEGMYNHLASALNKKNFLIHTGVLPIEAFKYSNNIIIENNSKLECYPCYTFNCNKHENHCENNLSIDYVINELDKYLKKN